LAYPYCAPSDLTLTSTYYIAARHCQGAIEANTPSNFYQISSIICGSAGSVNSTSAFITKFTSAASSKGWCVFLLHGIDNDGGYSPLSSTILRESLQYLDDRRGTFWVETFLNVVRYIRERNAVSVTESSNTGDIITLQVTDALDNTIYNYPVTIRRPLPEGWPSAVVTQNGQAADTYVLMVNSVRYVMFDVVPDGGDVVLTKDLYGDFVVNGIVDMNDLGYFVGSWTTEDCNDTNGVELNGDCIVNFYEFAVMAESWMQEP
jgi:oligosaccharide reducing-end xylanase